MSTQPFWYSTGEAPTVDPLLTISPGNSGYTAPPPTCVPILQQTPPYSDPRPTQRPDGTVSIPLPDDTDLKFIYPIEVQGHSGPLGGMMLAHWAKTAPDAPAPAAKWAPQTVELIPEPLSAQFVYVRGTSLYSENKPKARCYTRVGQLTYADLLTLFVREQRELVSSTDDWNYLWVVAIRRTRPGPDATVVWFPELRWRPLPISKELAEARLLKGKMKQ